MNPDNYTTKPKKWKHLSERERYDIELLLEKEYTVTEIAQTLKRHKRTIEREIDKGTVTKYVENKYLSRNPKVPDFIKKTYYSAKKGQEVADQRKKMKGRPVKIAKDMELIRHIESRIINDKYSPDAVIGEIKVKGLQFAYTVCTKTLYNMIDRGDFYNLTNKDLPVKKDKPKRKYKKVSKVAKNNLKGTSIEQRPEKVNNREEFGHWEMDLVVGSGKACLLVLTERVTRKEIIFKLPDKTQESVIKAIDQLESEYGDDFINVFKSITTDNGTEFLDQEGLQTSCLAEGEKRTQCYYAHPYSSWERGSNENANKLIRRFIPKGSNIGKYSEEEIKAVETWMNNYPRRIFGYKTAEQIYKNST